LATLVKVCGITHRDDAAASIDAGAGALGFNFWPGSPRYIPPERAAEFVPTLAGALRVGVFVDAAQEHIRAVAEMVGLDVVQLHGSFSPPPGLRIWRAVAVGPDFDAATLDDAVEAHLLDTPAGPERGGTGRAFDWSRVCGIPRRIVLAGGLDASNVRRAIEVARPWGVDACSRLESAPGVKDHRKVAEFCRAALDW
jgi:phosphoribosylanthranilate isomerase